MSLMHAVNNTGHTSRTYSKVLLKYKACLWFSFNICLIANTTSPLWKILSVYLTNWPCIFLSLSLSLILFHLLLFIIWTNSFFSLRLLCIAITPFLNIFFEISGSKIAKFFSKNNSGQSKYCTVLGDFSIKSFWKKFRWSEHVIGYAM